MMKRGLIIFLIVLIAGGAAAYWIFLQNSRLEEPQKPSSLDTGLAPSEVEGWNTYRSIKYRFQVKYPEDWFIQHDPEEGKFGFVLQLATVPVEQNIQSEGNWLETPLGFLGPPPRNEVWISIAGSEPKTHRCENEPQGFKRVPQQGPPGFLRKKLCAGFTDIFLYLYETDPNKEEHKVLLEKIASTFKTLAPAEVDPTINWKTYRNEQYGFEIKYPRDWIVDASGNESNEIAYIQCQLGPGGDTCGGTVKTYKDVPDLLSWFKKYHEFTEDLINKRSDPKPSFVFSYRQVSIDARPAIVQTILCNDKCYGAWPRKEYYLYDSGKVIALELNSLFPDADFPVFESILSTFKFIK